MQISSGLSSFITHPSSQSKLKAVTNSQLAAVKHPQQSILLPQLQKRETVDSMTARFKASYERAVQKGSHVNIRV